MKNKKPEKEELVELYVNKRLTTYEIADKYSVHRRSVNRWFKHYDIKVIPGQRKFEKIKKIPLTKEQKEMTIGMLLGDGFIGEHGRKNKSCRLHVGHSEKQRELVYHQKSIVDSLVNNIKRRIDKRDGSVMLSFTTITHNDFRFLRSLFYQGNKKIIRPELVNYMTEKSLAQWVMDDGSCGKCSMELHTEGFTEKENEMLRDMLRVKFKIVCKVRKIKRKNGKIYWCLSFNKKNSIILSNLVRKYIIDSMKYKILPLLND